MSYKFLTAYAAQIISPQIIPETVLFHFQSTFTSVLGSGVGTEIPPFKIVRKYLSGHFNETMQHENIQTGRSLIEIQC